MLNYFSTEINDKNSTMQDILYTLQNNVLFNGRLIKDISVISTADKTFDHGLGRIPNGYLIVKKTVNCDLIFKSSTTLTLTLRSSANSTISIWVF
jgi:hypothetical protein